MLTNAPVPPTLVDDSNSTVLCLTTPYLDNHTKTSL
jgi:hypothetical protein